MNAKICKRVLFLFATSIVTLTFTGDAFSQTSGCNYYASPTGGGNGLSQGSPFQIASFWAVASAGKTLCLLNGTYTGANSVIDPPDNLSGTSSNPITIKALNDGGVFIDGQAARIPIKLRLNNWFVIEGIDACCSSLEVVLVSRSNNNIIRRVVAWDAMDTNAMVFQVSYGATSNLFEDIAGFGVGRKMFESEGSNYTTVRRMWGRWEGSTQTGPKMVISLTYNNDHMIAENIIGTSSAESMPSVYQIMGSDGKPSPGSSCAGQLLTLPACFPYGILSRDNWSSQTTVPNSKYLGSITYTQSTDVINYTAPLFFPDGPQGYTFKDIVTYLDSSHSSIKNYYLGNGVDYGTPNTVDHMTHIGGAAGTAGSQWNLTNVLQSATMVDIYNNPKGASVCYQYKDGVLTSNPLWPWPMNSRILAATTRASAADHTHKIYEGYPNTVLTLKNDPHSVVDVTATIESIFGAIPTRCKGSDVTPPPPPPPPGSLTSLKTFAPITIDGSLNESVWSLANSVTFSNPTQSDNTVKVSTLWDDTNLYFAYDVTDANKEALNDPANLWQDDGAEIYLDTQNNKSTAMDTNDYAFTTNINDLVDRPGVIVKTLIKTTGYTQEIQIPWSVISTVPSAGKLLGLLLGNNDRDNGISAQFDWLNVISTGNYSQPNLWGSLALSGTTVGPTVPPTPPVPPGSLQVSVQ